MAYIYKIENDINDKIYIGKTNFSVEKRFKEHCADSKRNRKEKRPLYNAMSKYGEEHFYISVIEECSSDKASEREKYWIKYYNSYNDGYNATIGGDGKTLINYKKFLELYDTTSLTSSEIAKILNCSIDSIKNIVSQYRDNVEWEKRYYSSELHKHSLIASPIKVRCVEENLVFNSCILSSRNSSFVTLLLSIRITTFSLYENSANHQGKRCNLLFKQSTLNNLLKIRLNLIIYFG